MSNGPVSFGEGDVKDKVLSAQPRRHAEHAVSFPPCLRTIIEQQSLEELEAEDYEPITPPSRADTWPLLGRSAPDCALQAIDNSLLLAERGQSALTPEGRYRAWPQSRHVISGKYVIQESSNLEQIWKFTALAALERRRFGLGLITLVKHERFRRLHGLLTSMELRRYNRTFISISRLQKYCDTTCFLRHHVCGILMCPAYGEYQNPLSYHTSYCKSKN